MTKLEQAYRALDHLRESNANLWKRLAEADALIEKLLKEKENA